ncbi:MAG: cyclase family protein [Planctomycetaceae bacterium]
MRTVPVVVGGILIAVLAAWNFPPSNPGLAETVMTPADARQPPTLDELVSGKLSVVDLTWTLDDQNPYWPAENYEPFHLKTIATIEKNGVLSKAFYTPEHLGTHLDAPNHFENNQPSVDEISPADLVAHGVVIDISPQSEADADYRLTVEDLSRWEAEHGRIPNQAVVFLRTGWDRHWTNYPRYKNQDATGKMHFPGYSEAAARFLITERNSRGLGIDTLSMDYGLSQDFVVHHVVNRAGRYGLENVANLGRLPPRDFFVFVAPVKVKTGSGGPARILAAFRGEPASE